MSSCVPTGRRIGYLANGAEPGINARLPVLLGFFSETKNVVGSMLPNAKEYLLSGATSSALKENLPMNLACSSIP